ncbi:MAG TPA: GntR family transcriptional regulator [Pirellulales bacterium]|nr:GntR family transcriptional regulator [Pirellulales bacterium]
MRIEPDSHVPVYLQIVELLRSSIAAGVYRAGEGLPSLRVLSTDLRVNPNTVQRAFDELCRQGLIESRRGVGMFVAKRGTHSATARAEETAQAAFAQAAAAALAAGLDVDRVRELFESALPSASKKSRTKKTGVPS